MRGFLFISPERKPLPNDTKCKLSLFCHNDKRVFLPQEIRAAQLVASEATIRTHHHGSIPAPQLDFLGKKI
jgi:hypothetical protein